VTRFALILSNTVPVIEFNAKNMIFIKDIGRVFPFTTHLSLTNPNFKTPPTGTSTNPRPPPRRS
jgi:hypothetical protein